jgi:hypothetical protein
MKISILSLFFAISWRGLRITYMESEPFHSALLAVLSISESINMLTMINVKNHQKTYGRDLA